MNYNQGVDIFALGCVMIEMYLGYEAFQGKNTIDQLNKELVVLGTPS
jgi:mitogen-activated protein kinase 15